MVTKYIACYSANTYITMVTQLFWKHINHHGDTVNAYITMVTQYHGFEDCLYFVHNNSKVMLYASICTCMDLLVLQV